jgi:hypothetical protein
MIVVGGDLGGVTNIRMHSYTIGALYVFAFGSDRTLHSKIHMIESSFIFPR